MELSEMLATKPKDYLKNGFFDADDEFYEGINGEHSLGMAYRLREEKLTAAQLESIVDKLEAILNLQDSSIDEHPEIEIDGASKKGAQQIAASSEVTSAAALTELFAAAEPWTHNWKGFAAFTVHLRRILSQLALLTNLPPE